VKIVAVMHTPARLGGVEYTRSKMTKLRFGLVLAVITLVLCGCSREGGKEAYAAKNAPEPSKVDVARPVPTSLLITDYGPRAVLRGRPFNAQPDGSSAIWLKLDQPLLGGSAVVNFSGRELKTTVDGSVVTAIVPPSLIASPSNAKVVVQVALPDGGKISSNEVTISVSND